MYINRPHYPPPYCRVAVTPLPALDTSSVCGFRGKFEIVGSSSRSTTFPTYQTSLYTLAILHGTVDPKASSSTPG